MCLYHIGLSFPAAAGRPCNIVEWNEMASDLQKKSLGAKVSRDRGDRGPVVDSTSRLLAFAEQDQA